MSDRKYRIKIKAHKVEFVLGLLKNMPFVEITPLDEPTGEEEPD